MAMVRGALEPLVSYLCNTLSGQYVYQKIADAFAKIPSLYIADGHHRSAAAVRVHEKRKKENKSHSGNEAYNFFLAVIFPHNQMQILPYNRVVKDLKGLTPGQFLEKLRQVGIVEIVD